MDTNWLGSKDKGFSKVNWKVLFLSAFTGKTKDVESWFVSNNWLPTSRNDTLTRSENKVESSLVVSSNTIDNKTISKPLILKINLFAITGVNN